MGEWPPNWAELIRGIRCEMCAAGRPDAVRYGIRIYEGKYSDALYRFRTRRRCCDLRIGRMNRLRQDRGLCPFACST